MSRLPDARNPMRLADSMASTAFTSAVNGPTELLMTSVPPNDDLSINHIHGIFAGKIPLRTSHVKSWPGTLEHLQCLHCGGPCNFGPPVPVARHYDSQIDQYWVFGPFCRPSCSLGHICETDSTSKQLSATVELMRRYFGIREVTIAPPRASHWRFGGPLSDFDFYGSSGYACTTTLQPPFVTFANYVVGVHQGLSGSQGTKTHALLPQSAGRLIGIERPSVRHAPIAEKKSSGKAPLFLEFLATLSSANDIKDHNEAIDVKKAKRSRTETTEAPNFLKQYVKKTVL